MHENGKLVTRPEHGIMAHNEGGWCTMAGKSDQVKGQVKEAVGSLTDDKDLESEGRANRRAGATKEKVADAKDKIEEVIDKAKDALHHK